jgi:carboxyl-terminal processing protease
MKRKIFIFLAFILLITLLPARDQDIWSQSLQKLSSIMSAVEENYFKDLNQEELTYSAIRGIIQTLDPHSYFLDPSLFSRLREEQEGKYYGLGILIQKQGDRLVVISPLEGTPAYRLGIQPGDIISNINGESTKPLSSYDAMQKLRGPKGTKVTITIVREELEKPFELTIEREEIPLYSVPYAFMLQGDIGYIFIRNFAENTTKEFEEKMQSLLKQGMKKLVLDLRRDTGGLFIPSVEIAEKFLPKGSLIVSIQGRNRFFNRELKAERDNEYENIPLVILIDRGTASAPEILSGAIKDNDRGLIVGEDSFGKGLVQTIHMIDSNVAVALTTAKYFTPSGMSIQRDYNNLDDWLLRKEVPEEKREVRYTLKGRKVLGQGGISPDYKVEASFRPITLDLLLRGAFFSYARKFAAKNTPLSKEYIFPQEIQTVPSGSQRGKVIGKDFSVDARVLEDFKDYLHQIRKSFNQAQFDEAREEIKRELEKEIISIIFGVDEGNKRYQQSDAFVRKAIEVMPEASAMIGK